MSDPSNFESRRRPQVPATYDEMFVTGSDATIYSLPYQRSPYFPMYRAVQRMLKRVTPTNVLEVGCGTGPLAHMLMNCASVDYQGFDFSPVAVQAAKARTGKPDAFFVADATAAATYADLNYKAIVCTEVLEHIEQDLKAMAHWASGTYCVCSVPNYDADTHVRYFRTADEVRERYGRLIEIETIIKRRKPFLDDLSLRSRLQELRWNRYRPARLLRALGVSQFDRDGGWFIFSGYRRAS